MLTKFEVENYRGFKSFRMDGLAEVNLLVGMNNSGKTALLEGLQLLTSAGDPAVLSEIASRRGEHIISREEVNRIQVLVDAAHFFHGHSLGPGSAFTLKGDNGYKPISVKVVEITQQKDLLEGSETMQGVTPPYALRIDQGARPEKRQHVFLITKDGGIDMDVGARGRPFGSSRRPERSPAMFIRTESLDTNSLAELWDRVTLDGLEEEVTSALKLLEPSVQSVHMLTGAFSRGFFASRAGVVLGLGGQKARIPLGSMGDGMRRLLALATALACAKGGTLFIDEIDTGLHFSVMARMWNLVIDKAIKSKTQVFATTHSWDCVEGLSEVCRLGAGTSDQVAVHKIDRAISHSVAFSGASVVNMVKGEVDPR